MSNIDDQVRELIKLVNDKESGIKEATNPIWETNCVYKMDNITRNIRSISDVDDAISLYKRILSDYKNHNEACKDLGLELEYKFNNFTLEQWKNDFKNVVSNITLSREKKNLSILKSKLDNLVSEDERKRIELESIKRELGL